MTSPWLAEPTRASRAEIERAHDELLAGNLDALTAVRPLVRASWSRALSGSVASEAFPPLDLEGAELEAYRSAHPLAGALPLVRSLLLPGSDDDSGVVVALGDASGRLLWVEGDHDLRARVGAMGFVEGANWAEEHVGTAAPGTALALGRSVQVRGSEHFNRLVRPWSCTAAPIRDTESGRLLGVIDVTGGDEAATPQAQMLVNATARAVENELLVARIRAANVRDAPPARRRPRAADRASLSVLGRDRALLTVGSGSEESTVALGLRHAEILLMLAVHRQGLTAEHLAELVYGDAAAIGTLRPEMVRLRRFLERRAPLIVPESRPYRIRPVETDAQQVLTLVARGAHRIALATLRGEVLPGSHAPGVEALRDDIRASLRETLLTEASVDTLLDYVDSDLGSGDADALAQLLRMLPPRSPRRAGIVARLENLG
ncbi:transcriptional regulator [Microbacterium sorbitolivorans]|uniref:GAF domain-containing protein n=1 Tax=Microbacterium sorbitolivorans TaxID=1867410 RepID=A0A367Y711_9MICO|nr:GAF domain-containing protein [Microbacterium sorbitolivorans]RCK61400.1 GAF domain-containing protein [Microbacterium sorbitolivorans]GGF32558.1 transcriptional regulator [Microbacterium sorbitolivorans]